MMRASGGWRAPRSGSLAPRHRTSSATADRPIAGLIALPDQTLSSRVGPAHCAEGRDAGRIHAPHTSLHRLFQPAPCRTTVEAHMSMKHRSVFRTRNVEDADRAVKSALGSGIPEDDVYIVARPDIEVRRVSNRRKMADSDLIPSAMRGVLMGAGIGLVLGIVIVMVWGAPLYSVLIAMGVVGAMGGLGGSLAGASVSDPIRGHFQSEIESGAVLVVVDAEPEKLAAVQHAMEDAGASRMPYDAPSAMT